MVSEMVLSSEGLVADVAGVRPLVCVGPLVDEQVVGLGEMPAAELANKFLFGLGREPAPGGLPVRGQLAQLGDAPPESRGQLGQVRGPGRVLLCGCQGQVGEVEARSLLAQGLRSVRRARLLGLQQLRREGQRGEGDAGVHQALRRGHLRDSGPQALDVRVAQSPVVHVHGVHGAQAVQALQLLGREAVDGLQEGVVELQRRVQGDRGVQGFAAHRGSELCTGHGHNLRRSTHRTYEGLLVWKRFYAFYLSSNQVPLSVISVCNYVFTFFLKCTIKKNSDSSFSHWLLNICLITHQPFTFNALGTFRTYFILSLPRSSSQVSSVISPQNKTIKCAGRRIYEGWMSFSWKGFIQET